MKKLTSLVAMLMMVSTSAFAQFANSGASSTSSSAADTDGWQGVTASYNIGKLSYDIEGAKDMDFDGFSIGYVKAFSISKSLPLFVETGLGLTYASGEEKGGDFGSYDDDYGWDDGDYGYDWYDYDYGYDYDYDDFVAKMEYTYIGLTVPVNIAYKYTLNEDIQIIPFTGVYLRAGVISKVKVDMGGESKDYDLFDDKKAKEIGLSDSWNRFQFGWQIGAKVAYKQFTAGISYGTDLNEIAKKTKMNNLSISVGYNF